MNNKTAFLTVIYPISEKHLNRFFQSLSQQIEKKWEIIIINDGYKDLASVIRKYSLNYGKILDGVSNISENRKLGIDYILHKKYEHIIFGDCDDFFSENRINESLKLLDAHQIVVNDFTTVNTSDKVLTRKILSKKLVNNSIIDKEFIRDKNIFGLSNTALKTKVLKNIIYHKDVIAFDWFLFTQIFLNQNVEAIFSNSMITYYRQSNSNLAGFKQFSAEKIMKDIFIVKKHYQILSPIYKDYLPFFDKLIELEIELKNNPDNRNKLAQSLKRSLDQHIFWWEYITNNL